VIDSVGSWFFAFHSNRLGLLTLDDPTSAPLFPVDPDLFASPRNIPQHEAATPTRGRESPVRVTQHTRDGPCHKPTNAGNSPESAFLRSMLHKGHESAAQLTIG
jgi:hypothetical protein